MDKRIALFVFGCIGSRSLLVLAARNQTILPYLGYFAIIVSIGFMYQYLQYKPANTGAFGGRVWWNDLRPVHSVLYGLFAYGAVTHHRNAWTILLADLLIGIIGFLVHYRFIVLPLFST